MAPGGGGGDSRERWWSCSRDGEVRRRGTTWGLGEDGTFSSGCAEVKAKHPSGDLQVAAGTMWLDLKETGRDRAKGS